MTGVLTHLFALTIVTRERLARDDRGATAVEYGLMVGLIAVAIIAAVILLGGSLSTLFGNVSNRMPSG